MQFLYLDNRKRPTMGAGRFIFNFRPGEIDVRKNTRSATAAQGAP